MGLSKKRDTRNEICWKGLHSTCKKKNNSGRLWINKQQTGTQRRWTQNFIKIDGDCI